MISKLKHFNKIILAIIIVAIISICAFFVVLNSNSTAYALKETEYVSGFVKSTYFVNEKFNVSSVKIKDANGGDVDASLQSVVFPNGKAYSFDGEFNLDEVGRYTATYKAGDCYAKKSFDVVQNKYTGLKQDVTVQTKEFKCYQNKKNIKGLYATFSDGETLTYNKPIVINKTGFNELVCFHINTSMVESGNPINRFDFTFTDVYDPDNYISIVLYYDANFYWKAGATGQTQNGLIFNRTGIQIDGVNYSVSTRAGSIDIVSSLIGNTIVFDADTNRLYSKSDKRAWLNGGALYKLITDFDEEKIYRHKVWKGFTTGEVYMSMTASEFMLSEAEVCIESIGSVKGDDLKNEVYQDSDAPTISLVQDIDENNINISQNEKFDLFDIEVLDASPVISQKTEVFYNYGSQGEVRLSIDNNSIIPSNRGIYTIKYTAVDSFGNVASKLVKVNCVATDNGKNINLTYDKLSSLQAGKDYDLSNYSVKGINKDISVKVFVINPNGQKQEIKDIFRPSKLGEYTIEYVYTDSIKTYVDSYKVTNIASDNININMDSFHAPLYYLKGFDYSIDHVQAYSYENENPTPHEVEYFVSNDDGEFVKIENYRKFNITASKTVQFKFEYKGQQALSSKINVRDVHNGEELDIVKYFDFDFDDVKATSDFVAFTANGNKERAQAQFIRDVVADKFQFKFKSDELNCNFTTLKVLLSDAYDKSITQQIVYTQQGNKMLITSSSTSQVLTLDRTFNDKSIFSMEYEPTNKLVVLEDSSKVDLDLSIFPSGRCNITFALEGISGKAQVNLLRINNQAMTMITCDESEGEFIVKKVGGQYGTGETITTNIPVYSDLLSTMLKDQMTIKIRKPGGAVVISTDGISLDNVPLDRKYSFVVDTLGKYIIEYNIYDTAGNKSTKADRDIINVIDANAPTISLTNKVTNGKVGHAITLATPIVSDNITPKEELSVTTVVYRDGIVAIVFNEKSFIPTQKGEYIVRYLVCDKAGNTAQDSYVIVVE